jgi:hypothetical protein
MMRRFAGLAVALTLVAATPAKADEPPGDDRACYDVAVVGRILDANNFVGLDELLPPPPEKEGQDVIWFGGRSDFRIRVEVSSGNTQLPERMTVQAIMSALPVRNSAILFFVQKLEDGRWFAVDWEWADRDWLDRYVIHSGLDGQPPKCASKRKRIGDA